MEEILAEFTKALADAIRTKDGTTAPINPQDFVAKILALPNGEPITNEIRIFYDNTKPASKFGGTWSETEFSAGTFLMAAGDGGVAGKYEDHANPGGFHTLLSNELAIHDHSFNAATTVQWTTVNPNGHGFFVNADGTDRAQPIYGASAPAGGSSPFDIRPPTRTVHIWRKVS